MSLDAVRKTPEGYNGYIAFRIKYAILFLFGVLNAKLKNQMIFPLIGVRCQFVCEKHLSLSLFSLSPSVFGVTTV